MIVIMDEVHNLIEPGFAVTEDKKDRKEKVKACRDGIKTARFCYTWRNSDSNCV